MKKIKLENRVKEAVIVKIVRRKYFVYVTEENNCEVIKIISYSNFSKEQPQTLLSFKNSVFLKIAYDGKYLYVARRNMEKKLEKYRIFKENDAFLAAKVKEINLPNSMSNIQSMISSKEGTVAIFDMYDGIIYEIEDDKLEVIKCVKSKYGSIMHQELCYIGDKLYSTDDFLHNDNLESFINEFSSLKVGDSVRLLCYNNYTDEMIYGLGNMLYFERDYFRNGYIYLEDRQILNIKLYDKNLVVCCNLKSNGYIIELTPKDVLKEKIKSIKLIKKSKDKKRKIMMMIAFCSDGDENVFNNFLNEFKIRGVDMYEDLTKVKKEHLTGIDAFEKYMFYKYN